MPRYFTLEEARAALPFVGRRLREAVQAKSRYQEAEESMQTLARRIVVQGGMMVDTRAAEQVVSQRDSGGQNLKSALDDIEEMGVLIKDLATGLVDFPVLYREREVYLCWRMDEDDIRHWHGTDEGFASRRAIDSDFLNHHRGEDSA